MSKTKEKFAECGKEYILTNEILIKKQKISKMILCDLIFSCKKYGITILSTFGTLLGAVRHKGFIPWDDDIDVCAFYWEFNKIIECVNKEFPDKYFFDGCGVENDNDPFYGMKMMLKNTKEIEVSTSNYPYVRGLSIDIFPIVETYSSTFMRFFHKQKIKFLIHAGSLSFEYKHPPLTLKSNNLKIRKYYKKRRNIGFLLAPYYSVIHKMLLKTFSKRRSGHFFLIDGLMNSKSKYYFSKEQVNSISEYDFEDLSIPSFSDCNFALKVFYGENYMDIPPIEKRESHPYIEIDFGKYGK